MILLDSVALLILRTLYDGTIRQRLHNSSFIALDPIVIQLALACVYRAAAITAYIDHASNKKGNFTSNKLET